MSSFFVHSSSLLPFVSFLVSIPLLSFYCFCVTIFDALFSNLPVHFVLRLAYVFSVSQDLINRWIEDVPLLVDPIQAASATMDWFHSLYKLGLYSRILNHVKLLLSCVVMPTLWEYTCTCDESKMFYKCYIRWLLWIGLSIHPTATK